MKRVAEIFGRDIRSVRGWLSSAEKTLGVELVRAAIDPGRKSGRKYLSLRNSKAIDASAVQFTAYCDEIFGAEQLKRDGNAFLKLPRKKSLR